MLERNGMIEHTLPTTPVKVDKPWGRFEQYTHNLPLTVKIITVEPGGSLSRQYHHGRDELWVILDPDIRVELAEEILDPEPEEKIFIPRGTVHRLSCVGERAARILEVSFGVFDEDDIVRIEDVYGRADLLGDGEEEAPSEAWAAIDDGRTRGIVVD